MEEEIIKQIKKSFNHRIFFNHYNYLIKGYIVSFVARAIHIEKGVIINEKEIENQIDIGLKEGWLKYTDHFEFFIALVEIKEINCKTCSKPNDHDVNNCWWCGGKIK